MCAGRALRPLRLSKRYRACAQHRLYRPDAGVAAHYGAIVTDQRKLLAGGTFVDLSNREVLNISGADPLTLLHPLTTQFLEGLAPHTPTKALILSPQGRVEHAFAGYGDGETFWAHTEPGDGAALAGFLDKMKFMMRVEVTEVTEDWAVLGMPGQAYELVPRAELDDQPARLGDPVGTWAWEALRIEAGRPRLGLDTDEKTIPNEVGWIPSAVRRAGWRCCTWMDLSNTCRREAARSNSTARRSGSSDRRHATTNSDRSPLPSSSATSTSTLR